MANSSFPEGTLVVVIDRGDNGTANVPCSGEVISRTRLPGGAVEYEVLLDVGGTGLYPEQDVRKMKI